MAEHIVAVFRTNDAALAAVADLQTAGIPASAIRRFVNSESAEQPATDMSTHTSEGFWSWLFGDESATTRSAYATDADAYDRSAAAGSVIVSVTVNDDSKIHQAIVALEAHRPVDIDESGDDVDEREQPGTAPQAAGSTAGKEFSSGEVAQAGAVNAVPTDGPVGAGAGRVDTGRATATTDTTASKSAVAASDPEQVIPLAEEELEVGKRTVDRGTTRIRRYVVEKPVEESVTLRGERVTVERRRPIGAAAAPDGAAFEERVVEVHETAEEPVVSKSAHVVEEVVVGRQATERTETVKDTVRREDVEIANGVDVKR